MPEDLEICRECGGRCCKNLPGPLSPDDVGRFRYEIKLKLPKLLETGKYIFDYYEGQFGGQKGRSYFLRPALMVEVHDDIKYVHDSWGGVCFFLSQTTGCILPYKKRPKTCRTLIPYSKEKREKEKGCGIVYDKDESIRDWYKYQNLIEELIAELKERAVS